IAGQQRGTAVSLRLGDCALLQPRRMRKGGHHTLAAQLRAVRHAVGRRLVVRGDRGEAVITRRGLIRSALALVAAPAIVRAASIMPVRSIDALEVFAVRSI